MARVEKITVDKANRRFVSESGRPWAPIGVSYFRPHTGWAPRVWKDFDPEATRRDFARLKDEGASVVRVFLAANAFWTTRDQLDPVALAKFDQFLDLADEAGLHVYPAGPDRWEGDPSWMAGIAAPEGLIDGQRDYLTSLGYFWSMWASRYRGRNTIFAYDIRNEPCIAWNTPVMMERWAEWRRQHANELAEIPRPLSDPDSGVLLDFQHFRESLATEWIRVQAAAIRESDSAALVSVGKIQWSIPAQRFPPDQNSGFRPGNIAPYLDFLDLHYYPFATGVYNYRTPADETANLAVVESMVRECARTGLPVVLGEFGWYGGGLFQGHFADEDQQASWCRKLVLTLSPLVCGWLNWGLYDTPEATDVSALTGLLTVDGRRKAWGAAFRELTTSFREDPPAFVLPDRPDLPWDACLTSGEAMADFCQDYLNVFQQARSPIDTRSR